MLKKHLHKILKLVFIFVFSYFINIKYIFAQTFQPVKTPSFTEIGRMINSFNSNILQNSVLLLSALALVVFLFSLVSFLVKRAKGDTQSLKNDKEAMLWGLIALFVLVSVWGIIRFAQDMIGISGDNNINLPRICIGDNCGQQASQNPASGVGGNQNGEGFNDKGGSAPKVDEGAVSYSASSVLSWTPSMKVGSSNNKSSEVKELQQILKDKTGASIPVDGIFGKETEAALKSFQSANGMVADGEVGPTVRSFFAYIYLGYYDPSNSLIEDAISDWPEYVTQDVFPTTKQSEILQAMLLQEGCYGAGGNTDVPGVFGTNSILALNRFQENNSLLITKTPALNQATKAALMSSQTYSCK